MNSASTPVRPSWIVAVVACAAQFMVVLDTTIVNVALPSVRADLGLDAAGQQWVVNGYLLAFAGFLMLGGRAADLFGLRRTFLLGLLLFTAASLAGGLATTGPVLIGLRVLQGLGAALLAPAPLSLIASTYQDAGMRTRAISWWGITATAAGSCGILLGGVLTDAFGWRWVLFVNVPIGAVLVVTTLRSLAGVPNARTGRRLDVLGAVLVTGALGAAAYGLTGLADTPLVAWSTGGVLIAAVVLLAAFVLVEQAVTAPLVPLRIFRSRELVLGNASALAVGAVTTSALYFVTLYLQQVRGATPLQAGVSMLPLTVAIAVGSVLVRRAVGRYGPRLPLAAGWVVTTAGLVWLGFLSPTGSFWVDVLGPSVLVGLGLGTIVLPMTLAATSGSAGDAGLCSALMNTARQMGGNLGLACLSAVAVAVTGASIAPAPVTAGYSTALFGAAGLAAVAGLLGAFLRAPRPVAEPGAAPARPGVVGSAR